MGNWSSIFNHASPGHRIKVSFICYEPTGFKSEIQAQQAKKGFYDIKPGRNAFAAIDTGNIRPKVFWRRSTTVSKRDSVKILAAVHTHTKGGTNYTAELKLITAKWWFRSWNPTCVQQIRVKHVQHTETPTTAPRQCRQDTGRHLLQHPFFTNNPLSPRGANALKDGENQAEVWKEGLQITKSHPRSKPPGQPAAATLVRFPGKTTGNNPSCPSSKHQR